MEAFASWNRCHSSLQKSSSSLRLGLVHNPLRLGGGKISRAVQVALATLPAPIARSLVTKLVKEENALGLQAGSKSLQDLEVHVSVGWRCRLQDGLVVSW